MSLKRKVTVPRGKPALIPRDGTPRAALVYLPAITNDDVASLSIGDASVAEGNTGTTMLSLPVTLSAKSTQTVSVGYATRTDGDLRSAYAIRSE